MSFGLLLLVSIAAESLTPLPHPVYARVEGWRDGAVHVSSPVTQAQSRALERRGVPALPEGEVVLSDAVQGGRLHRVLRVASTLRDAGGEAMIFRLHGQKVSLILGRARDGHLEILDVRPHR